MLVVVQAYVIMPLFYILGAGYYTQNNGMITSANYIQGSCRKNVAKHALRHTILQTRSGVVGWAHARQPRALVLMVAAVHTLPHES